MARIVLGLATSHTPQCSVDPDFWKQMGSVDRSRPDFAERAKLASPAIARQLTDEILKSKYERVQTAIARLAHTLRAASPDVLVVFGDDQHELFLDDGIPTFAVFIGKSIEDYPLENPAILPAAIRAANWARHGEVTETYPCMPELGRHIVEQLIDSDFDVTQFSRQAGGRSIGHAWTFIRWRLMREGATIPMIPISINAYYPPNQPSARRCFALGRQVRMAIESWSTDLKVAVIASGGLSHRNIDESFDQRVIKALSENDVKTLETLPRSTLQDGTSETLNWVAAGGALEHLRMSLVDYVPGYRSVAGTGVGMTFAEWR